MQQIRGPWNAVLLALPFIAAGIALVAVEPLAQPLAYHDFADRRPLAGIPNFADVITNICFLIPGLLGLGLCIRKKPPGALGAWRAFFLGLVLVAGGSAFYHWAPGNASLVWDRLAMSVAFAAFYVALLAEYADPRLERVLLTPVLVVGAGTVIHWAGADDLRFYFALQGTVFASALVLLGAYGNAFRDKAFILGGLACYALAIVLEQLDRTVFQATGGIVGGHAAKHLMAGIAGYLAYRMLRARRAQAA